MSLDVVFHLQATDDSLEKGLEAALEAGYRHIDTAAAYENEDIIGKVLKRWFDAKKLKREDIFVTTKLSALTLYAEKVEECLKTSLQKLQLDYVDLYLLHFPVAFRINDEGQYVSGNTDHEAIWKVTIYYLYLYRKYLLNNRKLLLFSFTQTICSFSFLKCLHNFYHVTSTTHCS